MLKLAERWKAVYPDAGIGVTVMRGVVNPERHGLLEERKKDLEELLRARYSTQDRAALKQHPVLQAYAAYYRRFDKTYHVQLQLESIAFRSKGIPRVSGLVEAMFMAELKNLLLTAGHDLDAIRGEVVVDAAEGTEVYQTLSGREQTLKPLDMFIRDEEGILSSILYGPDQRTRITPQTSRVLFTIYAPPGIDAGLVLEHMRDLSANVSVLAPGAVVERMEVYPAAMKTAG
jgi:DNA/RNA-binding domain of Phe-tRNA-synthetase-like protein